MIKCFFCRHWCWVCKACNEDYPAPDECINGSDFKLHIDGRMAMMLITVVTLVIASVLVIVG